MDKKIGEKTNVNGGYLIVIRTLEKEGSKKFYVSRISNKTKRIEATDLIERAKRFKTYEKAQEVAKLIKGNYNISIEKDIWEIAFKGEACFI